MREVLSLVLHVHRIVCVLDGFQLLVDIRWGEYITPYYIQLSIFELTDKNPFLVINLVLFNP